MVAELSPGIVPAGTGHEVDPLEHLVDLQRRRCQRRAPMRVNLKALVCQPAFTARFTAHVDETLSAQPPDSRRIDAGPVSLVSLLIRSEHPSLVAGFCRGPLTEFIGPAGRPADIVYGLVEGLGDDGPGAGNFVSDAANFFLGILKFSRDSVRAQDIHQESCRVAWVACDTIRTLSMLGSAGDSVDRIVVRKKAPCCQRAVVSEDRRTDRDEATLVFGQVEGLSFRSCIPPHPGQCSFNIRGVPTDNFWSDRVPGMSLRVGLDPQSTRLIDGSEFLPVHEASGFEFAKGDIIVPDVFQSGSQSGPRVYEVRADKYGSMKSSAAEQWRGIDPIVQISIVKGQNNRVLRSRLFALHVGLESFETYGLKTPVSEKVEELGKCLYWLRQMSPSPAVTPEADAVEHHDGHYRGVSKERHGGFLYCDA